MGMQEHFKIVMYIAELPKNKHKAVLSQVYHSQN